MIETQSHVVQERLHKRLKKEFEQTRKRRLKLHLGYDTFVTLVGDNTLTLREVALTLGVSRQLVGMMYQKYVAPLENNIRHPRVQAVQRKDRFRDTMMAVPALAAVARKAQDEGYDVEPSIGPNNTFHLKQMRINGKLCGLRTARRPNATNNQLKSVYANFGVDIRLFQHFDAVILLSEVPGYQPRLYIVPMSVLLTLAVSKRSVQIYVPLDHFPKKNYGKPAVDWWQYENAWQHLS